jgi:hypothetical protein
MTDIPSIGIRRIDDALELAPPPAGEDAGELPKFDGIWAFDTKSGGPPGAFAVVL